MTKTYGKRISCKGNVKAAQAIIEPIAARTKTAMHLAFKSAMKTPSKVNFKIELAIRNGAGTKPTGRGWTADVSHRTFKALQASGVFA